MGILFLKNALNRVLGNNDATVISEQNTKEISNQSSSESSTDERAEKKHSFQEAVSYAHINREFGEGFLFSPESLRVDAREIDVYTSGTRHDIEEKYRGARIAIFESAVYQKIVRLSLSIPTFDSGDREYDSWHDLFLLQEHAGIIRAVYCTGGYRIAKVEGYAQVYQYPESLKKYFQNM